MLVVVGLVACAHGRPAGEPSATEASEASVILRVAEVKPGCPADKYLNVLLETVSAPRRTSALLLRAGSHPPVGQVFIGYKDAKPGPLEGWCPALETDAMTTIFFPVKDLEEARAMLAGEKDNELRPGERPARRIAGNPHIRLPEGVRREMA